MAFRIELQLQNCYDALLTFPSKQRKILSMQIQHAKTLGLFFQDNLHRQSPAFGKVWPFMDFYVDER